MFNKSFYDARAFKDFDQFFVGFDKLAERLHTVADQVPNNKYPPYNLSKVDENKYAVEIAVSGFAKEDLDIEIADDKLIVKGNVKIEQSDITGLAEEGDWVYPIFLHNGLAKRPFTRTFSLADNVEIRGASLLNGILRIELEAIIPEHKKPKKIEINNQDEVEGKAK